MRVSIDYFEKDHKTSCNCCGCDLEPIEHLSNTQAFDYIEDAVKFIDRAICHAYTMELVLEVRINCTK